MQATATEETVAKRVALYARVSTRNSGQDLETQLMALREFAGYRGFTIAAEYVDIGIFWGQGAPSGTGPSDGR